MINKHIVYSTFLNVWPLLFHMWLLFLAVWYHCDDFKCGASGSYRCCINKTYDWSLETPGHHCSNLEIHQSVYSKELPHLLLGGCCGILYYCLNYTYISPNPIQTPQLMPTSTSVPTPESTSARTYAKLTVRSHSKTETDLAVTLATAIFQ